MKNLFALVAFMLALSITSLTPAFADSQEAAAKTETKTEEATDTKAADTDAKDEAASGDDKKAENKDKKKGADGEEPECE